MKQRKYQPIKYWVPKYIGQTNAVNWEKNLPENREPLRQKSRRELLLYEFYWLLSLKRELCIEAQTRQINRESNRKLHAKAFYFQ